MRLGQVTPGLVADRCATSTQGETMSHMCQSTIAEQGIQKIDFLACTQYATRLRYLLIAQGNAWHYSIIKEESSVSLVPLFNLARFNLRTSRTPPVGQSSDMVLHGCFIYF